MSLLHDPDLVRAEYETETGLAARKAAYANAEGPDAPRLVFSAQLFGGVEVPELEQPLVVRRRPVIFVATK